jgi:hypothetical protein
LRRYIVEVRVTWLSRLTSFRDHIDERKHMLNLLKRAFHVGAVCALLGMLVPTMAAAQPAPNLTAYRTIANDTLKLVAAGNMGGASKKMLDLESKWDASGLQTSLPDLDDEMDTVKDAVDSGNAKKATAELNSYLQMLAKVSKPRAP